MKSRGTGFGTAPTRSGTYRSRTQMLVSTLGSLSLLRCVGRSRRDRPTLRYVHTGSRTADAALAAAAALVYGALIFTILIAQPHHGDIAAGIRDWLIASATVIAAAGAVWAAVIAAKAYSRQTADQRRAQASSVAAWIENEIKTTGAGN